MQKQKRRDTSVELAIRRRLHARGLRYRVDYRAETSLRVRGDIVFTRRKVIVFVDGCFWHGCPQHATAPKTNAEWWRAKLDANVERDRKNTVALHTRGWCVVRVWEHDEAEAAVDEIVRALASRDLPGRER